MNDIEFKKECIDGNEVLTVYWDGPWRSFRIDVFPCEYDLICCIIYAIDIRMECIKGLLLTSKAKEILMNKIMEVLKGE